MTHAKRSLPSATRAPLRKPSASQRSIEIYETYLTEHVERALETVRRFLGKRQASIVRALLWKNLETDPVSRKLLNEAMKTVWPAQRSRSPGVARGKTQRNNGSNTP